MPAAAASVGPCAGRPARRAQDLAALAALTALGAALFVIRLTGAPDLLENEFRVGGTVLDLLQHGHWLCPRDVLGNTDKPPMLTWLSALVSLAVGHVDRFTLYLPTAVATVAVGWLKQWAIHSGIFPAKS